MRGLGLPRRRSVQAAVRRVLHQGDHHCIGAAKLRCRYGYRSGVRHLPRLKAIFSSTAGLCCRLKRRQYFALGRAVGIQCNSYVYTIGRSDTHCRITAISAAANNSSPSPLTLASFSPVKLRISSERAYQEDLPVLPYAAYLSAEYPATLVAVTNADAALSPLMAVAIVPVPTEANSYRHRNIEINRDNGFAAFLRHRYVTCRRAVGAAHNADFDIIAVCAAVIGLMRRLRMPLPNTPEPSAKDVRRVAVGCFIFQRVICFKRGVVACVFQQALAVCVRRADRADNIGIGGQVCRVGEERDRACAVAISVTMVPSAKLVSSSVMALS